MLVNGFEARKRLQQSSALLIIRFNRANNYISLAVAARELIFQLPPLKRNTK